MNPYTLPDAELERLLLDDAPCGDATTFALGIGERPGRLVMRARYDMTVCGSEEAVRMGEHRAFLPGEVPADTVRRLRRQWPERPVVVEVSGEAEAMRWIEAGADVIQLEKMPLEALARLRASLPERPGRPRLAAAGGITPANAHAHAAAGADLLVTSAPYFAPPRDVAESLTPD
ncbi:beta/alpha barrel domain-containing protein [Cognatazoarcus halotolerans]|uniref:hypothetical protein n=1 Tax=Cognatazoarcus halotolerans TaxID=2686016 RepID=UPI00135B2749|nr:hypothetical protein [Cognatazoarcus halotolerans]MBX3679947.1 hypothetical protein [Rhodocyclaceae bacterium]MCP5308409.1 hypothetical protein [Zoogloeaceae bacterium]